MRAGGFISVESVSRHMYVPLWDNEQRITNKNHCDSGVLSVAQRNVSLLIAARPQRGRCWWQCRERLHGNLFITHYLLLNSTRRGDCCRLLANIIHYPGTNNIAKLIDTGITDMVNTLGTLAFIVYQTRSSEDGQMLGCRRLTNPQLFR